MGMHKNQVDIKFLEELSWQVGFDLPTTQSFEALRETLAKWISGLINQHFDELVRLLYRIDVNENKLKFLLQEKVGENAAFIIADLIIERQLQKAESRKQYQQPPSDESKEERW
jgi:hypothetical protein